MSLQSRFAAIVASLALGLGGWVMPGAAQAQVDPPSRVARLSYLSGNVSFAPAGAEEWVEANLNRPLITGDRLWADTQSRTELEIGAAVIRLDQSSGFNFINLDDHTAQVELTQGTLNLRVSRIYDDQVYEVDTPSLAFVVSRVGEYRFDVDPNGNVTTVTVFDGAGDVYGEHGSRFSIDDHQSVRFNDSELRDYQSSDLPPPDDFDRFCLQRDDRQEHSASRQYVAEEVIGASDLDANGDWQAVPEYGHVWYPNHVSADWAPYRDGHWAWVDPWGWTWVDAASWGFAPFHYGRWAYVSNRWGWIPGPLDARPVYAPALVGFIGGHGWGVGIGGVAPVGWFPLGPHEVFVPGYHVGHDYFDRVNYSNSRFDRNVNITNVYNNYSSGNITINQTNYAYHNAPYAVTAVPGNVFTGARPVAAANLRMDRATLERGQIASIAGLAPNRASLAAAGAARAAPPAQAFQRQVVARTAPPPPIAPFAQRQAGLQQNVGRTLPAPTRLAPSAAAVGGAAAGAAIAMHSNVRVVPQAAITARPMPIGRQSVSNPSGNGQPGAAKGPPNPPTTATALPNRVGGAGVANGSAPGRNDVRTDNVRNNAVGNNPAAASTNGPRPPLNTRATDDAVRTGGTQTPNKPLNTRIEPARTVTPNTVNPNGASAVQGNTVEKKLSDRPPNVRAPIGNGNAASPPSGGTVRNVGNGNGSVSSPQNAISRPNTTLQNNGNVAPKVNPSAASTDRTVRDRSVNTRPNSGTENNVVNPARATPVLREPTTTQNVIRNPNATLPPPPVKGPPPPPKSDSKDRDKDKDREHR